MAFKGEKGLGLGRARMESEFIKGVKVEYARVLQMNELV